VNQREIVLVAGDIPERLRAAAPICFLLLACLALLLTAPVDGDYSWNDAPRHALNGVFLKDLIAAHPFHDPEGWAIEYYLAHPALTVLFYPPLFYVAEAGVFAVLGVSQFAAQLTVVLFIALLAVSSYHLARTWLTRWPAAGAALLVIGEPETALWGRQVMLDLPSYALIVTATCFLVAYIRRGQKRDIWLTALFLLAAIYTKYNVALIAPALAVGFITAKGKAALRDRHALAAAVFSAVGLGPALFILLHFGSHNMQSVSGLEGTLPLNSLACWLFYVQILPQQLGWIMAALALPAVILLIRRCVTEAERWTYALLLAWLAIGYLTFTLTA
jgi:4-amino-4-deoxy-L-arabinose transferase-like glycosyltransferase